MDNFAATFANLPPSLNKLVRLLKVFPILASEPVAENKLLSLAIPKISEVGLINLANLIRIRFKLSYELNCIS